MTKPFVIHWFRQDLRLADNPALTAASRRGRVLPVYILDDKNCGEYAMGAASRWWLHHSLESLNTSLGGALSVYRGNPLDVLLDIIARYNADAVFWNRCYEPWRIQRDAAIKASLQIKGMDVESYNGSLLWEPWKIQNKDGNPYKVFTPYYRKGCLQAEAPRQPLPVPENAHYHQDKEKSIGIGQLKLLPTIRWDKSLEPHWTIGEQGAHTRFERFIDEGLAHYKDGRNFPAKPCVSRMSPHLHFGELSPNQLWHWVRGLADDKSIDVFCSELGWREFSYSQLYYHPDLPIKNLQPKFDNFPWQEDDAALKAWQQGQTGVPMVDAGMRELWRTGYMHNRVRMIVGSFLVKNLRLHWQHGEHWFWDTLVDADLANNSASWQWIAGCGADPAPYFRIFNPVTQGQKFDPDGVYVRQFVPELSAMPNQYLFNPWDAPEPVLKKAGIKPGTTYPLPIVDLKTSRDAALSAFQSLKKDSNSPG
ncbi:cryptochrome/photolyase family protein [Legionella spiritensis]|uniref:Deoxyribodipyrimidine photo-lyase n=1 Tax=Legionella spiritensis TaxID=452 RepID=A0A0W0Z1T6_LEGSP|nr:deoxyribodipyrimidine photo-lyase [Legionella spiritensis]KTD62694.1 deoxyribodipyrimidine photolyase [Legionella spiritensis]SNV31553.1 deoxyribodipyrimidine photolyase [Legionella spiritensis]